MRYIEWVSATLAAVDRVSRAHQASSFPVIAEALGIAAGEVTWERATQAGTAGHALTIALSDLAALGYVDFEAVVNGARITQGGRDALGRGLTVAWAEWWDEAHLNPTSLGFLRRLAAFAEQPTQRWADVGWVDAGDIWREGGPPLEPEDLDEWQQVHDAVGDLHGKNLVEAKMYGRDSVNVRPTFKGMMRALDEHPMSAGRRAGILDWVGPRPGWEVVEQRLHALIAELADATDGDAYKNLGRRARDLFDDVAAMVFDREMVPPGRAFDAVVWEADGVSYQTTFVSQRARDLLGYPAEEYLADPAFWESHLHPDDRDRAIAACEAAIRELGDVSLRPSAGFLVLAAA